MTNGEKIKEVFPNLEYEVKDHTVLTDIDNGVWFSLDFWNAEYKEPNKSEIPTGSTTKDDLGVDCISRKELLKIYENRFIELQKLKHLKDNKGAEDRQMGVNYCINILKEMPPVTSAQKWIPVSERLPEEIGTYLVTLEYKEHGKGITTLWYHGKQFGWDLRVADVVIAWMPLPKAYEPQESVE